MARDTIDIETNDVNTLSNTNSNGVNSYASFSESNVSNPEIGLSNTDVNMISANEMIDQRQEDDFIFKKPKRRLRRIIIPLIFIVIVGALVVLFLYSRQNNSAIQLSVNYINHTVGTHDITSTLSGTGTLKPADSYTVTTLISGEILDAPFEEGDIVEKGMLLYDVDSADTANSIEQAEISLAQSQRSYDQKLESLTDLNIKTTKSGEIVELMVEVGDTVNNGQTVAQIRDRATMSLEIYFGTDDAVRFNVGQSAEVTLDGSFEILGGVISEISPLEERLNGNMLVKLVKIDVSNPGGIAVGQAATAMVGSIACNSSGTFSYKSEETVTASASGEVAALYVRAGERVSSGQTIIALSSTSLDNEITNSADSLRNSELTLQSRYDQLDNYSITSPISGTIIEKYYKTGDTLESGKVLCTIFDLTYLTMTLNVDELDITSVSAGQSVSITVEALPGSVYKGVVTKVSINGATAGGVTSYPVTIRIDDTDGLLPGMNVQASIVVHSLENVVAIPVGALSRGNMVLVKSDASDSGPFEGMTPGGAQGTVPGTGQEIDPDANQSIRPGTGSGMNPDMNQGRGQAVNPGANSGMNSDMGQRLEQGTNSGFNSVPGSGTNPGRVSVINQGAGLPEGFVYVFVTPGISDGEYIEITSGLKEGDIIAYVDEGIPEANGGMFFVTGGPAGGGAMPAQRSGGNVVTGTRVG